MDMLLFWVTLGFLVETTRKIIMKSCSSKQKKEPNSLREPLLEPEVKLDASGRCRLACCAHNWEKEVGQEEIEDYLLESSEGGSYDSEIPDKLSSTTEDSDEAVTEDSEEELTPEILVLKWEDLLGNVKYVTVAGERRRSSKGKEIVEELEEEFTECDMPEQCEIVPVRIRKESRGKSSTKIHPEPLDPRPPSVQVPDSRSMKSGESSYHYGHKISDPSVWDHNFKADILVPAFTGECSKG